MAADTAVPAWVLTPPPPQSGLGLLLMLRGRLLRNIILQAARERPLRVAGMALSVLLIWAGLYQLLYQIFHVLRQPVLEGIVATPLIFTFLFLALTAMLTFSNAILSYGSLFSREESSYLRVLPVPARDVVIVRFLESVVLSSWSLLLLGVPLMLALARHFDEPWTFYPLFLGLFLCFIPIPGALGLSLAWLIALVAPKTPWRTLGVIAALLGLAACGWGYRIIHAPVSYADWLSHFYDQVSILQNALLPHTWVTRGIHYAIQGQPDQALFYLMVLLANALMAGFAGVGLVSWGYARAFARAQVCAGGSVHRSGRVIQAMAEVLFAYLPTPQRLLAAKDLKTFLRDPLQWSQMAILIGLFALYISNVQQWWTDLAHPSLQVLIAFLNQTAVCLILATFTCRFVFPMVSLEGQQLWLLNLLPLPRNRILIAKYLYALTITLTTAMAVMSISVYRLELPPALAAAHLVASGAVCIGLCGVSIGMGARLPVFHERNPARIAGGFGGTISLLLSIALVFASLAAVGLMSIQIARSGQGEVLSPAMVGWLCLILLLNVGAALAAMTLGIRHFNRLSC